jgi:cell volume regulation protein A
MTLLTYGAAAALNGNGFLAVYLAGLLLGNRDFIHRKSLIRFHDGLAWLMQIAMFLTLGLQVYPSRLLPVAGDGLLAAAFLIFVARPVSVLVSLLFSGMPFREKLFVAWVGLRGAAPIVLATFPLLYGVEKAETIFNLVFFIVFTSVLLQGTLIAPAARWLRVDDPNPPLSRSPLAAVMDDGSISADLAEIVLPVNCGVIGRRILDLSLPPGALIVLIGRQGEMVVPNGGTVLEAGDTVLLLARRDVQQQVRSLLTDPQPT